MSESDINEELKINAKFLINIESRTIEKKMKFTKWINTQSNPQNSFLSLVEHCIDRFGYEDVTDHKIAKRLHTEILYFNNSEDVHLSEKVLDTSHIQNDVTIEPNITNLKQIAEEKKK